MLTNTKNSYGTIAKLLHWGMALLFIGMFIVAYIMINITKSPFRYSLYDLHKATGLLIFALFAIRLGWKSVNIRLKPESFNRFQIRAAKINIALLYFLMFAMPASGFLTSMLGGHDVTFYHLFTITPFYLNNAGSEFFSSVHEYLSYILIAAFSLHVIATIYHHFFLRDNTFNRMWLQTKS